MTEPCTQLPAFERIDKKLDRALEALSTLAVQKSEIDHLIETQGDHREWLKGHEGRIQALEKQPGKMAVAALMLLATFGGSTVSGLIIYFVTRG